jgi:2-methylcitrate dehydratase PrpD
VEIHIPIDAALALAGKFSANDVARVEVATFEKACLDNFQEPSNSLAAKFSIPYSVAACFLWNKADQESFSEEKISSPEVGKLAHLIYVKHDPHFDEMLPLQGAKVIVHLKDGTTLKSLAEDSKGPSTIQTSKKLH